MIPWLKFGPVVLEKKSIKEKLTTDGSGELKMQK